MVVANTLSVILTIYNLQDCLTQTLRSLEGQSYQPLEVLLIDDGSTDNSAKIIDSFLSRNPNWKFYKTQNRGVAQARNLGFSLSTGDYILFLDGDDIFRNDFFSKMMSATDNLPDVVVCGAKEYDHNTGLTTSLHWGIKKKYFPYNRKCIEPEDLKGSIFFTFMGWPWDKIFRRKHLEKNHLLFPNLRNSEDLVLVYPALYLAKTINIVQEELVFHRVNRASSTSNNIHKDTNSVLQALILSLEILKQHPTAYQREKIAFEEWALDLLLWAFRQIPRTDFEARKQFQKFYFLWFPKSFRKKKESFYFPLIFQRTANFFTKNNRFIENVLYLSAVCRKYGVRRLVFRIAVKFKDRFSFL